MSNNHFGNLRTQVMQFTDLQKMIKRVVNSRNCPFHKCQYQIPFSIDIVCISWQIQNQMYNSQTRLT